MGETSSLSSYSSNIIAFEGLPYWMTDAWQLAAGSTPSLSLLCPGRVCLCSSYFLPPPLILLLLFFSSPLLLLSSSFFPSLILLSFSYHYTSLCSILSFPTLLFDVPLLGLILVVRDFQIC